MKVSNKVRQLREERAIGQNELALALEVSRQTIHAIEKGKYNPSLELSLKMARYFHLTIEEIFQLEEDEDED
ncbi:helix-turn-helix transcriptional regulator [Listeria innocua]|nr:helix-turn-helix transcriptional regulator [Listeria innocua]OET33118.1 transcriptional regulator [Listeria monocytogenes]EAF5657745.1 transcriptional regulator [Listeria innocua]EFR94976.1 transcriptional regulator [Listeria innocua FSL J1-023]MBC6149242.1 helix-turn-helix transcriptional regulator [Listeria innocua]UPH48022.1 helix-turn-helix transcriptional regulator [Listeria innocua]